jgi:hypothetical protein
MLIEQAVPVSWQFTFWEVLFLKNNVQFFCSAGFPFPLNKKLKTSCLNSRVILCSAWPFMFEGIDHLQPQSIDTLLYHSRRRMRLAKISIKKLKNRSARLWGSVSINYIKFSTSFPLETILIWYQIKYKAFVTLLVYILRYSLVNFTHLFGILLP